MANTYFISDTHFFHTNIIKYCNRPFTSTEEMNNEIIKRWNNTVGKNDIIWFLGDFALSNRDGTKDLIKKLNGNKKMIKGNHDHFPDSLYLEAGFTEVHKRPIILKEKFILSHAPILKTYGTEFINIHGHVHNKIYEEIDNEYFICVCVDVTNFTPVRLEVFDKC